MENQKRGTVLAIIVEADIITDSEYPH